MKIRTDFVTNSSSSSFVVEIIFELKNGKSIEYTEIGSDGEGDPVVGEIYVDISPRQLGMAKDVDELIKLLKRRIHDEDYPDKPAKLLFDEEDPEVKKILNGTAQKEAVEEGYYADFFVRQRKAHEKAQEFIKELEEIPSMEEIKQITITGNEENYVDYYREYSYDLETGKYTCRIEGDEFEKDGSSGGDLCFSDADQAIQLSYDDEYDEYEDDNEPEGIVRCCCCGNQFIEEVMIECGTEESFCGQCFRGEILSRLSGKEIISAAKKITQTIFLRFSDEEILSKMPEKIEANWYGNTVSKNYDKQNFFEKMKLGKYTPNKYGYIDDDFTALTIVAAKLGIYWEEFPELYAKCKKDWKED